jgi:hypothetical protein
MLAYCGRPCRAPRSLATDPLLRPAPDRLPSPLRQVLDVGAGNRSNLWGLHLRYGVGYGLIHAPPVNLDPLEVGGSEILADVASRTPDPAV